MSYYIMSKNIYNLAPSNTKNIYNSSQILAKNVKYNNSVSGLTGNNVQAAIDELASGSGGGVTTVETIGINSESLLVMSPDSGPIVELKGITGANNNTDVTVITSNNKLLFDVSQMQPLKAGVVHGRNDISSATSISPTMSIGYNTNPNYVGTDVLYVGDQNSLGTVNTKNKVISIGHYNTSLNLSTENDSILIGNHIKEIGGVNNDIYVGNDILKNNNKVLGNDTDNVIISNSGLLNNNGIVRNNCIIGDKLFVTTNGSAANIIDNIIIGSECELVDNNNFLNNILIGNKINSRTNNSIIIHQPLANTSFTANHDNMFYLGDNSNQPTQDNDFVISSGYNKYKVFGIPESLGASGDNDFILHYDEVTGEITRREPSNVGAGARVIRGDPSGLKLRSFIGDTGINVLESTDTINIGFDTAILPMDMEPTVSGLAYGKQDQGILFTGLGRELIPKNRTISLFNQTGSGDIQNYSGSDNILINNNDTQNIGTLSNMSNIITNNCITNDSIFNKSSILASQLNLPSIGCDKSIIIGNYDGQNVTNAFESIYLLSNSSPGSVTFQGGQSLYIGNSTSPEVVNSREAYISGYDRFFLRTPQNLSSIYQLYFDPITSEVTWDTIPGLYSLPAKLPGTLGGSYGYNNAGNASEVTGRNSFVNYISGVNLNGISSLGNNNFTSNVATTFLNSTVIGNSIRFNSLLNMTNNLLAMNVLTNTGVTSLTNNSIIIPKASSLTLGVGVSSITGANFLTSGDISLTGDPNYSVVVGSGSTVNPGANNMVMISGGNNSLITMQGLGNMLFQASGLSTNYTSSPFNNTVVFNSGSTTVPATASSQFCASHSSILVPNLNTVSTFDTNTLPMAHNSVTGLMSPTSSTFVSRVWRSIALTVAGGSVNFTPGSGINPSTNGYGFQATVRNSSGTVAYVAQIQNVNATTVTVQVFQSNTIVLGGQSMVPAPANIVVHFSMMF